MPSEGTDSGSQRSDLTRRFGEKAARRLLGLHEFDGDLRRRLGLGGQTAAAAAMDRRNNELGIAIGRRARTFDDLEAEARALMNFSHPSGDGVGGGAVWLPASEWKNNPKDDKTGEELPPSGWNWPETDWVKGIVDSDPSYRYPFGGEEHLYVPQIDDTGPFYKPGQERDTVPPLKRPVETWSEDDLRRVMASPAYLQPNHPGRARAHAMVREWFERAEASAAGRADATGRRVRGQASVAAPAGGTCEVPVRGHTRDGGKVDVDAHCRARPAA